jgi:hypothetical protein
MEPLVPPAPRPRFARRAAAHLLDAAGGLGVGIWLATRGVGLTWRAALGALGRGVSRLGAGDFRGGAFGLGACLARCALQTPADLVLMLGGRTVSAVQTAIGVEPPARRLEPGEETLLRGVFGEGIAYRRIRVKEGRLGLLGLPHRAFTHGDTLYVPPGWEAPAPRCSLLVHEAVHVWQHQRRGTGYMSEALLAQWLGEGYNFATALAAGRGWSELNPEQQAELVEQAYAHGYLAALAGTRRLLVKLIDRRRDHGFAVRVVNAAGPRRDPGDEAQSTVGADGWLDATEVLDEALRDLRRPRRSWRNSRRAGHDGPSPDS